jgi:hypothetical protein
MQHHYGSSVHKGAQKKNPESNKAKQLVCSFKISINKQKSKNKKFKISSTMQSFTILLILLVMYFYNMAPNTAPKRSTPLNGHAATGGVAQTCNSYGGGQANSLRYNG